MGDSMPDLYWLIFIIPVIITLQIGLFIFWAGKGFYLNRVFLLLSLLIVLWQLEGVAQLWTTLWNPILTIGGVFLPVAFLQFSLALTQRSTVVTRSLIFWGYTWAAVLLFFDYTPMAVLRVLVSPGQLGGYSWLGISLYLGYFLLFTLLSVYLLIRAYCQEGPERNRVSYLLVAIAAVAAILSGALRVLPLSTYGPSFASSLFSVAYIFVMGWAIWRYEVLNVTPTFRSAAVYSFVLTLVLLIYIGLVQFFGFWTYERLGWNPVWSGFLATLIIGPLFYPLRVYLDQSLEKFFPLAYDRYLVKMHRFSRELVDLLPLTELAEKILSFVVTVFDLPVAELVLLHPTGGMKTWRATQHNGTSHFNEGTFDALGICGESRCNITIPLSSRETTIGWLKLGQRWPEALTDQEIELISSLAGQAGTALQNAQLYTEISDLTQHYEALLAGTLNGVMVLDESLHLSTINRVAAEMFGITSERTKGRFLPELPGAEGLERVISKLKRTGEPVQLEETTVGPQDAPVPVQVTASFTKPVEEQTPSIILVLSDLSEQKVVEEQLRRTERLAAMGRLTAGLAHEIRNGLNKIGGFASILDDLVDDNPKLAYYAKGIQEDVEDLANLLNQFLMFAKEDPMQITEVDVVRVIQRNIEALHREALSAQIQVVTDFRCRPQVAGDAQRLTMVFFNLLINGLQALEAVGGGQLSVKVDQDDLYCLVEIADTGPGVPLQDQEAVFDPFYTTKEEGTGLGLPITYKIIRQHNGELSLRSTVGKGTTFFIKLPLETID